MIRSLFCLANASISGGNKAILEYARGLQQRGQTADVYVWHSKQNLDWFDKSLTVGNAPNFETALSAGYDTVFFAKAFLIPLAYSHLGSAKPVFICHDFESAYQSRSFDAIDLHCQPFDDVLTMPIDIITTSLPVQKTIRERLNRQAYFVPLAIDKALFPPGTISRDRAARSRILMVGDHLLPTKGIRDGLKALQILAKELPVELVLITREERGQQIFENLGYPCEIHVRPDPEKIRDIYASCDVYCCTSWYEGFGLPALEAFRVGLPVVSTRNSGVTNYGVDGQNLLLCEPNAPADMSAKLYKILTDALLHSHLVEQGKITEETFSWERASDEFIHAQSKILDGPASESISEQRIEEIVQSLEDYGLYTPQLVHEQCSELFSKIDTLLEQVSEQRIALEPGLLELKALRDRLRNFLNKPRAEYYNSCKKRYDLCQLVISLADDTRFRDHLSKLIGQHKRSEAREPQHRTAAQVGS